MSQSFLCCHFLLQTRCLCFCLHSYLQQVSNGSMLASELHVPQQYQKEGAGAHLHPWRFPGHRDGNAAPFPGFLMSFSHLWSPEPTGPAWPAAIRCLLCRNAGSHFSPGHYFPLHAPAESLEAAGCSCPVTSRASDSKPNTSTTGRRNTTTTSTGKHKELGTVLPGKHSPVLQTSAWCDLQKQKLIYTCTRWENFCVDLQHPDHNLLGKSKSEIVKKRAKWFCKTLTNFFLWFGICELPRVWQMPNQARLIVPFHNTASKLLLGWGTSWCQHHTQLFQNANLQLDTPPN